MSPVLPFLVAAAAATVLPRRAGQCVVLAAAIASAVILWNLDAGTTWEWSYFGFELQPLRVDRLSLAFGWVFTLVVFITAVFGWATMGRVERVAGAAAAAGALGVVFAGDLLTLFVFWEIKAVATTFVIWSRGSARSGAAGLRYLVFHVASGSVLLGGLLWHAATTGSLEFDVFNMGRGASWVILVAVLMAAAMPPLHAWIADAYPESTIAGTVLLSAFTTKAAVYTLARGFPGVEVLVWGGVAMAVYGVVFAILEDDIRRLLSYHIVSQVGFMVAAVGVGTAAAINGATAHAFAHIIYKGLLMMGAGAILYVTGRSRLSGLGGLARTMPWVAVLYLVAAFSISGVPLLSGFVSKGLAVDAIGADGHWFARWVLDVVAIGTFLSTALKLPYFAFWGPSAVSTAPSSLPRLVVPATMYAGMGLAAVACIVIGVRPDLMYDLMPFPVEYAPFAGYKIIDTFQYLGFAALAFWVLRHRLIPKPTVTTDVDWLYRRFPTVAIDRFSHPSEVGGRRLLPTITRDRVRIGLRSRSADRRHLMPIWWLGLTILAAFVVVFTLGLVA